MNTPNDVLRYAAFGILCLFLSGCGTRERTIFDKMRTDGYSQYSKKPPPHSNVWFMEKDCGLGRCEDLKAGRQKILDGITERLRVHLEQEIAKQNSKKNDREILIEFGFTCVTYPSKIACKHLSKHFGACLVPCPLEDTDPYRALEWTIVGDYKNNKIRSWQVKVEDLGVKELMERHKEN